MPLAIIPVNLAIEDASLNCTQQQVLHQSKSSSFPSCSSSDDYNNVHTVKSVFLQQLHYLLETQRDFIDINLIFSATVVIQAFTDMSDDQEEKRSQMMMKSQQQHQKKNKNKIGSVLIRIMEYCNRRKQNSADYDHETKESLFEIKNDMKFLTMKRNCGPMMQFIADTFFVKPALLLLSQELFCNRDKNNFYFGNAQNKKNNNNNFYLFDHSSSSSKINGDDEEEDKDECIPKTMESKTNFVDDVTKSFGDKKRSSFWHCFY